ncbi:piggyBac transposable element-derived protein 4 [Trichonephila inaurata madagascariensis]|uniref:PiggyBac transposable element-derived protein 4 n=1 Tax=Trichonephila inaurata madagascariensis TaxID=2747483 RepID=A0A8X6YAJ7_9ARAC|nr:piggyBac transposable element-derived protein 4 [Trichonephila inaurata madagascariensis]
MYFNNPKKPENAPKTYYMDEVMKCSKKKNILEARQDSPFQSIDESMAKFKSRSSLKQYSPLKPIKRGIKLWERCNSVTGYTYDMNIYAGKDLNTDRKTLGERVVLQLCSTIRNPDVTLAFDRFFTSVNLIDNINFPALGTCISTRRNMPKFGSGAKLAKESEFLQNRNGTLATRWQDSKEVIVLSNCHLPDITTVERTQRKWEEKKKTECPLLLLPIIKKIRGGVALPDQKVISERTFTKK